MDAIEQNGSARCERLIEIEIECEMLCQRKYVRDGFQE